VIGRRLAVAAVAILATIPFAGAMAAPPGPAELPNALANPLEASFVELTSSRQGDIIGYFDAGTYANWAGSDTSGRDYVRNVLQSNGFVTGYQRIWYVSSTSDTLFETVFVFKAANGAGSMLDTEKRDFSGSKDFRSWVDLQVNDNSFALQEVNPSDGFHWTFAAFVKGNDVFELFRGSKSDYQTTAAIAQAREMYMVAPNGTTLGSQPATSHQSALSRYLTPLIVVLVIGALLLTAALVIAVVATLVPRDQASPPVAAQPGP
jgi:hypothetical protein